MPISMTFPETLLLSEFSYELPHEKIARFPLVERDSSRLLVWKPGQIQETNYVHIAGFLPTSSLLVFNNSRVVEARIIFRKPSGGQIEIFCLGPHDSYSDVSGAMKQRGNVLWNCLIGGASKWKNGQTLHMEIGETKLNARVIEKRKEDFTITFSWTPESLAFAEVLHQLGSIPLPPYLGRNADAGDEERYQTVYAKEIGSVAAPTAGLHFSEELLKNLANRGIGSLYLTLHVGAGTFLPVKTDKIAGHVMHEEFIEVSSTGLEELIAHLGHPVIAVGTTSLRTLESLYWLGLQVYANKTLSPADLVLRQFYPYQNLANISPELALTSLLEWINRQPQKKLITKTQLYIVPGYTFKIVRGLVTNFHQPHSTLLLLVAALAGPEWKRVYEYALENNFRFLSYGDGCLFLP